MKEQLEELQAEIFELKEKLKETKEENRETHKEYVLDQAKTAIKKVIAVAAVPTIGTAITTLAGWNPFKLNEEKQQAYTITSIDKYGEVSEEKIYKGVLELKTNDSKLNYYTQWKPAEDGKYEREKYTYAVTEKDLEKIIEISNTYLTETKMDELFPYDKTVETEQQVSLTPEEISFPSYIEASVSKKNNGEYIKAQESENAHIQKLFLKLFVEALLLLMEISILEEKTKFFDKIEESEEREEPEPRDLEEIKEKIRKKQLLLKKVRLQQKGQ